MGTMDTREKVTASDFAAHFGSWAPRAQATDLEVVNAKTGRTIGFFISEQEYALLVAARAQQSKALFPWELDQSMLDALKRPLATRRPDLDALMDD